MYENYTLIYYHLSRLKFFLRSFLIRCVKSKKDIHISPYSERAYNDVSVLTFVFAQYRALFLIVIVCLGNSACSEYGQ